MNCVIKDKAKREKKKKRHSRALHDALTKCRRDGIRVALRHKWLIVRSSARGAAIGSLPGIGGSVIDWIAYGVTKLTVRDNENFGKGDIRGVIDRQSTRLNSSH